MAGMPNIVIENRVTQSRYCFMAATPQIALAFIRDRRTDPSEWDAWEEGPPDETGWRVLTPLPLTAGS